MRKFLRKEVEKACLEYFLGDSLAANVSYTKYLLKDKEGFFLEKTPDEMHWRMAKEFARIECNYSQENFKEVAKRFYNLFKHFKYIVPQGSVMYGLGNPKAISLSNCTVLPSPSDSISGIFKTTGDMANLFKRRCGVGLDISSLRWDGAYVDNSANSSTGAWSFADLFSYVTKKIGQNNRRGALLISLDVRHPDVVKFATSKYDETKVTGANISLKLVDEFYQAVENGEKFTLQWPVDSANPSFVQEVDARELFETIVEAATKTAAPGIFNFDRMLRYTPTYAYEALRTITTNPCGEVPLGANDSCRLISHNLLSYVIDPFTKDARFDFELFDKHCRFKTRLGDNLVELELEKILQILEKLDDEDEIDLWNKFYKIGKLGRRLGLGTHGLADALAALRIRYDSDEALEMVDEIYRKQMISCYDESVNLAIERGSFELFNWELEKDNEFIKQLPEWLQKRIAKHGRRNVALLTNAPTGSVAIESQVTSGLEPVFRFVHDRRRKLTESENIKPDFVDKTGDRFIKFKVFHHNVERWRKVTNGDVNNLPDYFVSSDKISWQKRVELQGVIQKSVDNSISSTINLPKGTSVEIVKEIYMEAWRKGLKGVTVYIDGTKDGILLSEESEKEEFIQKDALKRPEKLECDIHRMTIKGQKYIIFVGLYNKKPYEVMGGSSEHIEVPNNLMKGFLYKKQFKTVNSKYRFESGDFEIKEITKVFDNPNNEVVTRLVSFGLRHGAKPSDIVSQLQKDPDSDFFSFSKSLARALKKYIKDGEKVSTRYCKECGEENSLEYQEGCVTCMNCGWSKCG